MFRRDVSNLIRIASHRRGRHQFRHKMRSSGIKGLAFSEGRGKGKKKKGHKTEYCRSGKESHPQPRKTGRSPSRRALYKRTGVYLGENKKGKGEQEKKKKKLCNLLWSKDCKGLQLGLKEGGRGRGRAEGRVRTVARSQKTLGLSIHSVRKERYDVEA